MALTRLTQPFGAVMRMWQRYRGDVRGWGVKGDGVNDDYSAMNKAISDTKLNKKPIVLSCDIFTSKPLIITEDVSYKSNGHYIRPLDSFSGSFILKFGESNSESARGLIDSVHVDCKNLEATGIVFGHTSGLYCKFAKVINHNGHGIEHTGGYELTIEFETISTNTPINPTGSIEDSTNCGLRSTTSDSVYKGVSTGSDVGAMYRGGNNIILNSHNWGVYTNGMRVQRACFVDMGQNNTFENFIADSPNVIDKDQVASTTNGGYGIYTPLTGNAIGNRYKGSVIIPTIQSSLGTVPEDKLVAAHVGRSALEYDIVVVDRTNKAIYKKFDGGYADKCSHSTKLFNPENEEYVFQGESKRFEFQSQTWFTKGVVQAFSYAETPEKALAWGQGYQRVEGNYFFVKVNDGGITREVRVEKIQKGTNSQRSSLSLTDDDSGYKFFNTDTRKYNVWDGSQWTDLAGTPSVLNKEA